jgi:hypothetical protein
MKLYHYTQRKNLFGIAMRGLTPTPNDELGFMTLWQPAAWLTTQETLKPTEADWAHHRTKPGYREEDDARFAEAMLLERDVRLTVKIPTPDKRLVHYCTWMNEMTAYASDGTEHLGRDILEATNPVPTARKHWWLYLGTIKPSRIDLKLTPALALPGIESNIASAVEKGDDDRIADLTALREQIRAAPADALLRLMCSDKELRQ